MGERSGVGIFCLYFLYICVCNLKFLVRYLSWRFGLSFGFIVYIVMGNLVDKEIILFINSDLRIFSFWFDFGLLSFKVGRKFILSSLDEDY